MKEQDLIDLDFEKCFGEPKYQIGTKVIVCQDLKTEIEKIEFSEKYQEYIYWFRDEKGRLSNEAECAIEKIIDYYESSNTEQ